MPLYRLHLNSPAAQSDGPDRALARASIEVEKPTPLRAATALRRLLGSAPIDPNWLETYFPMRGWLRVQCVPARRKHARQAHLRLPAGSMRGLSADRLTP